jgi:hypothetical protein
MIGNNTRTWVVGTAVLGVVLLLAFWFLVIGPQRDAASELRAQALDLRSQEALLTSQTARLEQAEAHLPETRAELAALRTSVPATLGISDFTRTLTAAAAKGGVTLMSIAPATPAVDAAGTGAAGAVVPPDPAATADPAAGTTADVTTTDITPTPGPTAPVTGAVSGAGTVENPVTVQVIGSLAGGLVFLHELQHGDRAFLVTALAVTAEQAAPASAGRPATKNGDVTLNITGSLFVVPGDASATTTATTPAS